VKTVTLNEAQDRLDQLFDEAQAGSPVLLVRGDQVVKLERVEPPEFGGDIATLQNMLLEAVRGPHADWTAKDLEDIARRVRARRDE
jgi:antitoxin (DNA-binding transcriptional repressor) of toxin-antitoxin stability system